MDRSRFVDTLPVGNTPEEKRARREAIAAVRGGAVICGAVVVPNDPTGTHNLMANLDDIEALAREIGARKHFAGQRGEKK